MNTLHFRYAVEVEKTGSITQAADNLYMKQPNLSKAIKELEDTLAISIFKRTSKGVIPTQKGMEFLKYAKSVLAQIDEMESLYKKDDRNKQTFSVAIPRGSYIAKAVTNFVSSLDLSKAIDLSIKETNSIRAIDNVAEGIFNFGIIRYQVKYENYFIDFFNDRGMLHDGIWKYDYLAVMSENHPLAEKPDLQIGDFEDYIEVKYGDISVPYINIDEVREPFHESSNRKTINIYERCNQFDFLANVPETFMLESPIPKDVLERYHLVQRKCNAFGQKYKDVLIYPNGYTFTPIDKIFLDKLYESKNEVAFEKYA